MKFFSKSYIEGYFNKSIPIISSTIYQIQKIFLPIITKVQKKVILPKINSKKYIHISYNSNNLPPINNVKLNPTNKNYFKKSRTQCIDAEEYLQQFHHIPEIYNINEFNSKLIYLKKILLGKNIFLLKTGWNCVWDNPIYSIDKAEEMINKRYNHIIEERYKSYKIKYNLSKYNYPKNLMCLLYTKELVSFISVSDYSIYSGKITGFVKFNLNYINNDEINIIFSCMRETFFDRFKFDDKTNTIIIQLKRK